MHCEQYTQQFQLLLSDYSFGTSNIVDLAIYQNVAFYNIYFKAITLYVRQPRYVFCFHFRLSFFFLGTKKRKIETLRIRKNRILKENINYPIINQKMSMCFTNDVTAWLLWLCIRNLTTRPMTQYYT